MTRNAHLGSLITITHLVGTARVTFTMKITNGWQVKEVEQNGIEGMVRWQFPHINLIEATIA